MNPKFLGPAQMTPDQHARATNWLNTHWTTPACPFHGATTWGVSETLAEVRNFAAGGIQFGGGVYPLIIVTCQDCGYTVLVNAILAGVFGQNGGDRPESEYSESASSAPTTRDLGA